MVIGLGPLLYSNLDFEYELACVGHYCAPSTVQNVCSNWAGILRLLPQGREGVCFSWDGKSQSKKIDYSELIPWGVTPSVKELLRTLKLEDRLPSCEAVKRVNSKIYSHQLEQEWNCSIPGSCLVDSVQSLERAVEQCATDWVLKHPFGVGGRERLLGHLGEVLPQARNWTEKRLRTTEQLVFEPWLKKSSEFSHHYHISSDGEVDYLGKTQMWTGDDGSYLESLVNPKDDLQPPEWGTRACDALTRSGYWGPVGLDGMTGEFNGQPFHRPLTEINARYSFGRMALELGRLIPKGRPYAWWQPKRDDARLVGELALPFKRITQRESGVFRLPEWLQSKRSSAFVVTGDSTLEALDGNSPTKATLENLI